MNELLSNFLQRDVCKDRYVQLYCTNGELEDQIDTNKYIVKAYGREAARSCPLTIEDRFLYIEVERLSIPNLEHVRMLLALAERRTEMNGTPFKQEDYKWMLGANVIQELAAYGECVISSNNDCLRLLFGIAIDIDYADPNNIQLWENITNKV